MTWTDTAVNGAARADSAVKYEAFADSVQTLSEGSVNRSFDPFVDIDWDAPDMAVRADDRRWILQPNADPLGRHPWYLAQPESKQIAIGMWRQANIARAAVQFESVLMRGMMQYAVRQSNGAPEFRYIMHECKEECQHTLMFQEMVNRIGADVPGLPRWIRLISPLLPLYGSVFPSLFFMGVLGVEEPLDYAQRNLLRSSQQPLHPMLADVMAIHVAEEARHISFAHDFLRYRVGAMSAPSRFAFSLVVPLMIRQLCRCEIDPPKALSKRFDIPKSVIREAFWDADDSKKALADFFADLRMLAYEIKIMNPVAKRLWRWMQIDGPPARYRSQPQQDAAA